MPGQGEDEKHPLSSTPQDGGGNSEQDKSLCVLLGSSFINSREGLGGYWAGVGDREGGQ